MDRIFKVAAFLDRFAPTVALVTILLLYTVVAGLKAGLIMTAVTIIYVGFWIWWFDYRYRKGCCAVLQGD